MKRTTFCLLAGGLLTFAACQQESTTGMTQLQIDSAVNARVDSIRGDMMMRNDSMINALAMQKADSMLMARGSGAAGTTVGKTPRPNTGKTGTTQPTSPETTRPTTPQPTGKRTDDGTPTGKRNTTDASGKPVQEGQPTGKRH